MLILLVLLSSTVCGLHLERYSHQAFDPSIRPEFSNIPIVKASQYLTYNLHQFYNRTCSTSYDVRGANLYFQNQFSTEIRTPSRPYGIEFGQLFSGDYLRLDPTYASRYQFRSLENNPKQLKVSFYWGLPDGRTFEILLSTSNKQITINKSQKYQEQIYIKFCVRKYKSQTNPIPSWWCKQITFPLKFDVYDYMEKNYYLLDNICVGLTFSFLDLFKANKFTRKCRVFETSFAVSDDQSKCQPTL